MATKSTKRGVYWVIATVMAAVISIALASSGVFASRPADTSKAKPANAPQQQAGQKDGSTEATASSEKPQPKSQNPNTSQSAWIYFAWPSTTPIPVPTMLTYNVGTKFDMDLYVNSGNADNHISAQQSYLTYTLSVLQMVSATATSCVLTSVVVPDLNTFEAVLQNETCNGPSPCVFRGVSIGGGSFAFASGALSNCELGCQGLFRLAQTGWCASNGGVGRVHWQFTPPDPKIRDCQIVDITGDLVQGRTLYRDITVNVIGPTATATPSFTATATRTSSPTRTPTITPSPSPTFPPTLTFSPTSPPSPTRTNTPTPTVTLSRTPVPTFTNTTIPSSTPTITPILTITPTNTVAVINTPTNTPILSATPTATVTVGATETATVGVPSPTHTVCPITFTDVHSSDYFYVSVLYLACHGIISGYLDGTFRPYNTTTRGQMAKIITLAEGWPLVCPAIPTFTDVPTSNPFYCNIETAYARGIISGYADHTFRWGNNVTRAQTCKIVVLAEGWTNPCPTTATFRDVPITDTFFCYIETAYAHAVISGYTCGTGCLDFRPYTDVVRGQLAKIVYLAITQP